MAEIAALLRQFGFTEYEAKAYVALLRQSPQNGYELAKASGVPRADIYAALHRLEERSAVLRLDTEAGTRYAPVAPEDLLQQLERHFKENLGAARSALASIAAAPEFEYVWNSRGYDALLEQARVLIEAAHRQLLVALFPQESDSLSPELAEAEARGVKITTLCLAGCPGSCGHCQGQVHRHRIGPEDGSRWLVVVPDRTEVLAGEIGPDRETLAVRTRQKLLMELVSRYIENSIALVTVVQDLGGRLEGLLRPESMAVLASLGPLGEGNGFLDSLRDAGAEHKKG